MLSDSAQQQLEVLQEGYRRGLVEKAQALAEAWQAYVASAEDSLVLDTLYQRVHRLAGSAGSFGFSQLSVAAKDLQVGLLAVRAGESVDDLSDVYQFLQDEIHHLFPVFDHPLK